MNTSPSASCFADAAKYLSARVVFNREIAAHTFRIRLECPVIAAAALPGQFAMLRLPDRHDPLLASFRIAGTVVPLPASAWLFLSAAGLLGGMRRRRRNTAEA